MNHEKVYEYIQSQEEQKGPRGCIQWKGTEVCMDVHCACGASPHVDGRYFYFFRCEECGRKYAVSQVVKMIPLDEEMAEFIEKETDAGFITGY